MEHVRRRLRAQLAGHVGILVVVGTPPRPRAIHANHTRAEDVCLVIECLAWFLLVADSGNVRVCFVCCVLLAKKAFHFFVGSQRWLQQWQSTGPLSHWLQATQAALSTLQSLSSSSSLCLRRQKESALLMRFGRNTLGQTKL